MSKIICEVCGTSYPETATQCPICGCVSPGDVQIISGDQDEGAASGGYTYVKGGRFSKSNVRKRSRGIQVATSSVPKKKVKNDPNPVKDNPEQEDGPKNKKNGNKGLIITIIVLLLAIIAVIAYIAVRFLVPSLTNPTDPYDDVDVNVQGNVSEDATVPCTEILLDTDQILLQEEGQTVSLHINVLPADTTDKVSFASADESVAVVDENGVITAVERGETVITVTCGSIQAECTVTCDITDPQALAFRLNRQQITFDKLGAAWQLYSGEIPVEDIVWTSDDASIATCENGLVTAVGEGYTRVYGEYQGNKQSCEIVCSLSAGEYNGQEGNGGVGEDGGDDETAGSGEYHLDNLFSQYDTEVTISVGEWFPLQLVDSNGNKVDATWSVEDDSICKVSGGDVTALASGETYVIATYNGQEYRCLVRVN